MADVGEEGGDAIRFVLKVFCFLRLGGFEERKGSTHDAKHDFVVSDGAS